MLVKATLPNALRSAGEVRRFAGMASDSAIDPATGDPVVTSMVIPEGDFPVGMLPIDHPKLGQLYRYWDRQRAERAMPARSTRIAVL